MDNVVSIHAPAWGATRTLGLDDVTYRVSIHAPAWGATAGRPECEGPKNVSIHAPAWGATEQKQCNKPKTWFQSTRPRGARQYHRASIPDTSRVSIHAPAWGATGLLVYSWLY